MESKRKSKICVCGNTDAGLGNTLDLSRGINTCDYSKKTRSSQPTSKTETDGSASGASLSRDQRRYIRKAVEGLLVAIIGVEGTGLPGLTQTTVTLSAGAATISWNMTSRDGTVISRNLSLAPESLMHLIGKLTKKH